MSTTTSGARPIRGRRARWVVPIVSTGLLAAFGSAGIGLGSAHAAQKVHLTWWTWTGNPQAPIKNFEKHHPNITVTYHNVGVQSAEYTKLRAALTAGSGAPDVVQIEDDTLPEFIATGKLDNIAKYVSNVKKDFPTWVWNQMVSSGKVYAVPEDIGPMALVYEPAIFKKYKLSVPTTWAQFASDAAKLHKEDPNEFMIASPTGTWSNNSSTLTALFQQAGAQIFKRQSNGTWDIAIDTPVTRKVLSYWVGLSKKHLIDPGIESTASYDHNIATARYASYLLAAWGPGGVNQYVTKKQPQKFTAALLPTWTSSSHASADNGGSSNAVTDQAPNPKAAAEFAAFINSSASGVNVDITPYASNGKGRGLFPAAKIRTQVSEFNAPILDFAANTNKVFSESAKYIPTNIQWSPWTQDLFAQLGAEAGSVVSGKVSVSAALSKVQQTIVTDAQQAGYSVKSLTK